MVISSTRDKRSVLITGAAGGLGSAFSRQLAAEGWEVLAVDVSKERLEEALEDDSGALHWCAADVTLNEDVHQLFDLLDGQMGGLDAVVNAAGTIGAGTIDVPSIAQWEQLFAVNLMAAVRVSSLAAQRIKSNAGSPAGFVVNVGSAAAIGAHPRLAAYAASKAALASYTRSLAAGLAHDGIVSVLLVPGRVEEGMASRVAELEAAERGLDYEHVRAERLDEAPLGRFQSAEEVARVLSWVLSRDDTSLNGRAVWCDARTDPI